ncbi:MAG: undecaprenyl-phosphate alpha-N-acetylglucosaminyl 1-phosphate transferase [Candidatus Hydrogenedentota bacterium]
MTTWNLWYAVCAAALAMSFVVSLILTEVMRRVSLRWGVLDHPGERKLQAKPMPLLGGAAIWLTVYGVIGAGLAALFAIRPLDVQWVQDHVVSFLGSGSGVWWKLAGLFLGGACIFVLGLIDDMATLRPSMKLAGQIVSATVLVLFGIHVDFFNPYWPLNWLFTIGWVVMMTNSMNLLDNMDGLSSGVSAIAALSFFACVLPAGQTFVCVLLMVFAGAVAGFLFHNFHPARIFMGDAGAMFCGYFLATVAVLGTFYRHDTTASWVALAAPLLALGVPIFDTLSVMYIRWRRGESIMMGDKRHFSHRLVELGMTQRQAVEFIYFVAAVTGLGAALLHRLDGLGTAIVLAQAVGVFSLIVLLMNATVKGNRGG